MASSRPALESHADRDPFPSFARTVTRRHPLPGWTSENNGLYLPRRPTLPSLTPPVFPVQQARSPVSPSTVDVATSNAESRPFLLSTLKKPIFVPLTPTSNGSSTTPHPALTPKPLTESSYILPSETLSESRLAQSPATPKADPERVYPRVFYAPSELSGNALSLPISTLRSSDDTTPKCSPVASSSATTTTHITPTKPPPLDLRTSEDKRRDALVESRNELDVTGPTGDFEWFSGGSPDNTGSTHASSLEWQPADAVSDTDSGWEFGELGLVAHSDLSGDEVVEVDQLSESEQESQSPQSLYFDASEEMESSESEAEGNGRRSEDEDGYSADSEAIPRSRLHSRYSAYLDDELDASVPRQIPLGTIRDRRRLRMSKGDD
ncbi:hypothetical protein EIP86_010965 [Pleurotus ostreatoroseus]|nr:hypothetical protein EIP86_010965 [Pleurotus ostreatoroseus]